MTEAIRTTATKTDSVTTPLRKRKCILAHAVLPLSLRIADLGNAFPVNTGLAREMLWSAAEGLWVGTRLESGHFVSPEQEFSAGTDVRLLAASWRVARLPLATVGGAAGVDPSPSWAGDERQSRTELLRLSRLPAPRARPSSDAPARGLSRRMEALLSRVLPSAADSSVVCAGLP